MREKMTWSANPAGKSSDDVVEAVDVCNLVDFGNAKAAIIELFKNSESPIVFLDIKEHTGFSKRMIISVCEELRRDGLITASGSCGVEI